MGHCRSLLRQRHRRAPTRLCNVLLSSAYPGPHLNEVGCDEGPYQETPDSGAVTEELDAETPAKKTRRTWPPLIRKWAVKYETLKQGLMWSRAVPEVHVLRVRCWYSLQLCRCQRSAAPVGEGEGAAFVCGCASGSRRGHAEYEKSADRGHAK